LPSLIKDSQQVLNPGYNGEAILLDLIKSGEEQRKVVVLRNIPNRLTVADLRQILGSQACGFFAFIHAPVDPKRGSNLGYAFVTFHHSADIAMFCSKFQGFQWNTLTKSEKVAGVIFSKHQCNLDSPELGLRNLTSVRGSSADDRVTYLQRIASNTLVCEPWKAPQRAAPSPNRGYNNHHYAARNTESSWRSNAKPAYGSADSWSTTTRSSGGSQTLRQSQVRDMNNWGRHATGFAQQQMYRPMQYAPRPQGPPCGDEDYAIMHGRQMQQQHRRVASVLPVTTKPVTFESLALEATLPCMKSPNSSTTAYSALRKNSGDSSLNAMAMPFKPMTFKSLALEATPPCMKSPNSSTTTAYTALRNDGDASPNAMAVGGWDSDAFTGSSPY
jgi:hypothetical protein